MSSTTVVEAEPLRIARESHDIVTYDFATINVRAGVAGHVVGERPEQAAEVLGAVGQRGGAFPVIPAVDRAAYGIVREALTNALRHAGPGRASVWVACGDDHVVLEVVDDGCGGSANAGLGAGPPPLGGFGVRAGLPIGVRS
jgi:signal transduction histidine kinase